MARTIRDGFRWDPSGLATGRVTPVVLTGAVGIRDSAHTRRRLLGAAAGTALGSTGLAGCGLFDDEPDPVPPPDPLTPVLDAALALAAVHDRTIATQPALAGRLTPIADAHRAHAAELVRVIGTPPPSAGTSAGPSVAPPALDAIAALKSLRAAEQQAQRAAATACRRAPAERAMLVGTIAAARAAHAEALR